ncbi:hypothetical protein D9M68_766150 [compost metagenome]
MGTQLIAEHGAGVQVVYLAGFGPTVLAAVIDPDVGLHPSGAQRQEVNRSREVLAVDVFQFRVVVAQGQGVGPAIIAADEVELLGTRSRLEPPIGGCQCDRLIVGRVPQVHPVHPSGVQRESIDVFGYAIGSTK